MRSLYPSLITVEILISVTAYNGNPQVRYCVQRKSLYALPRTTEIPISDTAARAGENPQSESFTAYNGGSYLPYYVQLKSQNALEGFAKKSTSQHTPDRLLRLAKIHNQNPLKLVLVLLSSPHGKRRQHQHHGSAGNESKCPQIGGCSFKASQNCLHN